MVRHPFSLLTLAALFATSPAPAQDEFKDLDPPYVPTPQVVVDRMLDLAQVKSGDMLIDLGSGDGRLVIAAARERGAHGFGVEIDPRLVKLSNANAQRAGVADRARFLQEDLFTTDISEANVLTLYLLPDVNLKLRPKILAELAPGARVVSHDYDMGDWKPDAQETVAAPTKSVGLHKQSTVYLWIVPAKVAGEWELEIGGRRLALRLAQRYQSVSGTVGEGKSISDGRLRGDELRMTLPGGIVGSEPLELVGAVKGNSLSGETRTARREITTWSARRR
jgi:SAM-dependent methyltransferase